MRKSMSIVLAMFILLAMLVPMSTIAKENSLATGYLLADCNGFTLSSDMSGEWDIFLDGNLVGSYDFEVGVETDYPWPTEVVPTLRIQDQGMHLLEAKPSEEEWANEYYQSVEFSPCTGCQAVGSGSAVIDGDTVEWTGSPSALLYVEGSVWNQPTAEIRLMFGCPNTMSILVTSYEQLTEDWNDVIVLVDNQATTLGEKAWVYDDGLIMGWEASFPVIAGYRSLQVNTGDDSYLIFDIWVGCSPTAVILGVFELQEKEGGVLISWETGAELNNLGFEIYRNTVPTIESGATRITGDSLILSQGVMGAQYSFLDDTAVEGVYYYYWLTDTEPFYDGGVLTYMIGVHYLGQARWTQPRLVFANPAEYVGSYVDAYTFKGRYRDNGQNLAYCYMLFGDSPVAEGGVFVRYDVVMNKFSIYDEVTGTWALPGVSPEETVALSAVYGSLRGAKSTLYWTKESRVATVSYRVKFKVGFVGTHNIYMMAVDSAGNSIGWAQMGTVDILP